jgi:predicted nucleotidyltransferase
MGKDKRTSDVDIALLLDDREASFQYLEFKVTLERALNIDVDLTILNNAGEILKHQIRKYGKIIFESNPKMRKQWEVLSRKLFQDFLYLHHIYMKKLYAHYGVENG